jgi:hypothetical protein
VGKFEGGTDFWPRKGTKRHKKGEEVGKFECGKVGEEVGKWNVLRVGRFEGGMGMGKVKGEG